MKTPFLAICILLHLIFIRCEEELLAWYTIDEEEPPGTNIGNVAEDSDLSDLYSSDVLRLLKFGFLNSNKDYVNYFDIDESSGLLRTKIKLDRDTLCGNEPSCQILVEIAVRPIEYFKVIKAYVGIRDINDNRPTFDERRITLAIGETTAPGATFALPQAKDSDIGRYGIQGYRLEQDIPTFDLDVRSHPDNSKFAHLVLRKKLDREITSGYVLKIEAYDGGSPPKSRKLTVDVQVVDANDNAPHFDNSTYDIHINENELIGSTIGRVRAHDSDFGDNGRIQYSLSDKSKDEYGDLFGISSSDGTISIRGNVNYEDKKLYVLSVIARDSATNPLDAYATVFVHVNDVNDHAPSITVNTLTTTGSAEILETAPEGTFVAHISVHDPDEGSNGEFTCYMQNINFELIKMSQSEYKIISRVVFDREMKEIYRVTMSCTDHGQIAQTAIEEITITVLDINDNDPVFQKPSYRVEIYENNQIGDSIQRIYALDADTGDNSNLVFSIEHIASEEFKNEYDDEIDEKEFRKVEINSESGLITASDIFDHEAAAYFEYLITVTDRGDPPRNATATFTILVLDENDEAPYFIAPLYTFGTFENQPAGTEIGTIDAIDYDSPPYDEITYRIDRNCGFQRCRDALIFDIDPKSGRITTNKMLDREEVSEYHFHVIASNEGYPLMTSKTNVTVYIGDRNDNPPIIIFPSERNNTIELSSLARIGAIVTKIEVRDRDIGTNAQLIFEIIEGNTDGLFQIMPSQGTLVVAKDLSNERMRMHPISVLVRDRGDVDKGESVMSAVTKFNILVNNTAALVSKQTQSTVMNNRTAMLIIGLLVFAIIFIVILLVLLFVLKRRRDRRNKLQKYNCRVEASKVMMTMNSNKGVNMDTSMVTSEDTGSTMSDKSWAGADVVKTWPGDGAKWSNDDFPPNIANNPNNSFRGGSIDRRPPQEMYSAPPRPQRGSASSNKFMSPSVLYRVKDDNIRVEGQGPHSPMKEINLQVHGMLEDIRDHDTDRDSITDSGKGPSEEGDPHRADSPMGKLTDMQGFQRDPRYSQVNTVATPPRSSSLNKFPSASGQNDKLHPNICYGKRRCPDPPKYSNGPIPDPPKYTNGPINSGHGSNTSLRRNSPLGISASYRHTPNNKMGSQNSNIDNMGCPVTDNDSVRSVTPQTRDKGCLTPSQGSMTPPRGILSPASVCGTGVVNQKAQPKSVHFKPHGKHRSITAPHHKGLPFSTFKSDSSQQSKEPCTPNDVQHSAGQYVPGKNSSFECESHDDLSDGETTTSGSYTMDPCEDPNSSLDEPRYNTRHVMI